MKSFEICHWTTVQLYPGFTPKLLSWCSWWVHDSGKDSDAAATSTHSDEEPHDDHIVHVDPPTGLPGIRFASISSGVIPRADRSNLSVSYNKTCDEPSKANTSEWTTDAIHKFLPNFTFSSSIQELEHSYDNGSNVDPESPPKPCDELLGHIFVPSLLCSAWNRATTTSPAWALVRVIESILVEVVGENTVDDDVDTTTSSLRSSLVFHNDFGVRFVIKILIQIQNR